MTVDAIERFRENPYYHPEKCGLEIVKVDKRNLSYEFDMVVLWRVQETGELFWGSDNGCSCPEPFEGVRGLSDLNRLVQTVEGYEREVARIRRDEH